MRLVCSSYRKHVKFIGINRRAPIRFTRLLELWSYGLDIDRPERHMSSNLKTFTDEEAGTTTGEFVLSALIAMLAIFLAVVGVRLSSSRPGF